MKKMLAVFIAAASTLLSAVPGRNPVAVEPYRDWNIASIQDRPMTMPQQLFSSIDPQETFQTAKSYRASLNVFLIMDKLSGRHALIDTGFGKPDSALLKTLALLKIKPENIAAVFITHLHRDHVGGLTSADGKPVFPNAKLYIAAKEYQEWLKDGSRANLGVHLSPYRHQLVQLEYDKEVQPYGLVPLYYPGHTPGHTVFRMKPAVEGDKTKTVYFVGDIVHAAELQIPRPRFCARFDMDPKIAVKSRCELLSLADCWYGAHLPFPGILKITRQDNQFDFQLKQMP